MKRTRPPHWTEPWDSAAIAAESTSDADEAPATLWLPGTQASAGGGMPCCTAISVVLCIVHALGGDVCAPPTYAACLAAAVALHPTARETLRMCAWTSARISRTARRVAASTVARQPGPALAADIDRYWRGAEPPNSFAADIGAWAARQAVGALDTEGAPPAGELLEFDDVMQLASRVFVAAPSPFAWDRPFRAVTLCLSARVAHILKRLALISYIGALNSARTGAVLAATITALDGAIERAHELALELGGFGDALARIEHYVATEAPPVFAALYQLPLDVLVERALLCTPTLGAVCTLHALVKVAIDGDADDDDADTTHRVLLACNRPELALVMNAQLHKLERDAPHPRVPWTYDELADAGDDPALCLIRVDATTPPTVNPITLAEMLLFMDAQPVDVRVCASLTTTEPKHTTSVMRNDAGHYLLIDPMVGDGARTRVRMATTADAACAALGAHPASAVVATVNFVIQRQSPPPSSTLSS